MMEYIRRIFKAFAPPKRIEPTDPVHHFIDFSEYEYPEKELDKVFADVLAGLKDIHFRYDAQIELSEEIEEIIKRVERLRDNRIVDGAEMSLYGVPVLFVPPSDDLIDRKWRIFMRQKDEG